MKKSATKTTAKAKKQSALKWVTINQLSLLNDSFKFESNRDILSLWYDASETIDAQMRLNAVNAWYKEHEEDADSARFFNTHFMSTFESTIGKLLGGDCDFRISDTYSDIFTKSLANAPILSYIGCSPDEPDFLAVSFEDEDDLESEIGYITVPMTVTYDDLLRYYETKDIKELADDGDFQKLCVDLVHDREFHYNSIISDRYCKLNEFDGWSDAIDTLGELFTVCGSLARDIGEKELAVRFVDAKYLLDNLRRECYFPHEPVGIETISRTFFEDVNKLVMALGVTKLPSVAALRKRNAGGQKKK